MAFNGVRQVISKSGAGTPLRSLMAFDGIQHWLSKCGAGTKLGSFMAFDGSDTGYNSVVLGPQGARSLF